jgi:hypothetical protein
MPENYHGNLTVEDQVWAEETSIARGWEQPEGTTYVVGCEICGFFTRQVLSLNIAYGPGAEGFFERSIDGQFVAEAERSGCPHWAKYLEYRKNHAARQTFGFLALSRIMKVAPREGE